MRAVWVIIAAVGLVSCAGGGQSGKQSAGASALGAPLFCNPCTVPCASPCVPAQAAKFQPAPGAFTSPQSVTLSTPTPGAVIRYTTDGTAPTEKSPVYKGAIPVEQTTTVKAMAQVPGLPRSEVTSGTYAIAPPPAPAPPPVAAAPAPVEVKPEKLELDQKVLFETGQATIESSSEPLLDMVAGALQEHPEVERVRIEGHTDAEGGDAVNERLSRERAEAVRIYLIQKGVEPDRLEAQGFGASRPLADNATSEGREANRRVDFIVVAPSDRAPETGTGSGGTGTGASGEAGTDSPPSR